MLFLSVLSIFVITVGYATLNNVLKIGGYASIDTGSGMIFTAINTKENNGATIESAPGIRAKTIINTKVSFTGTGSITFTVAAQNQGEYDAKLIEIQKLESLNNSEPTCIQISVTNHDIGETVSNGVVKTFEVTITSTCSTYSTKEIEIYFNYQKQETQGGVLPKPPASGNSVDYLVDNELESSVSDGGSGLVAIDNSGEITTSSSPREYRYIGSNPNNYVMFNNELWRIIGVFDGQLKIIRKDSLGEMTWDSNNVNDWSQATLQTYLNGEYLNSMDATSQGYISNYTWKLGGSSTYNDVTAQMFYERESGTEVYEGRPTEWTGKIGLMYPSDYGFATSGGSTTNRTACLEKELYNWYSSSIGDCKNNSWLYDSSDGQWTLTPGAYGAIGVFYVYWNGYVRGSNVEVSFGARPSLYLKSKVEFIGGYGTEEQPYILDMKYTATDYLVDNKLQSSVPAGGNGLIAIDNSGEITTSSNPREYRYIGANPDNYIQFNNELWRIIGIFDGQLKIIRKDRLGHMAWNTNGKNDWSQASLQTYLNGDYLHSIDSISQGYISTYTWKLGAARGYTSATNGLAQHFYNYERETDRYDETRPLEWTGKIGLMYPSDYGFATSGGSTTNRTSCLAKELYNWDSSSVSDCKNNSWLYDSSDYQWTLAPYAGDALRVFRVDRSGIVYYERVSGSIGVHPSVNLLSNVQIASGTGTDTDPYILTG